MPELTLVYFGLLASAALAGIILGWILRSSRNKREKMALNAGWQAQIDSKQTEQERLAAQSKSLMQQVSESQALNNDASARADDLSKSLEQAHARRDKLQREMKDIRGNLEAAIMQRDKLESDVTASSMRGDAAANSLKKKEVDIGVLQAELAKWQDRVPPLVERYRQRDLEAQQLEIELQKANDRIAELEERASADHARIESVNPASLPDGLHESNEPHAESSVAAKEAEDPPDDPFDQMAERAIIRHSDAANDEADNRSDTHRGPAEPDGPAEETASPNTVNDDFENSPGTVDDLEQIKGIGPSIAKILNDLGIYRYSQIAEMSEYDIDRVANEIKGFRSRIYREDWIGQARTLRYQQHNDQQPF